MLFAFCASESYQGLQARRQASIHTLTFSLRLVGKNAIEVIDETQLKNPEGASFEDELNKKVDYADEYDELVPKLPSYEVHQFGKNIGYTKVRLKILYPYILFKVPIVTRKKPSWSTPMPHVLLEKTWSTPDILRHKMTKTSKGSESTTPKSQIDEELLPPDNEPTITESTSTESTSTESTSTEPIKKHRLSGGHRHPTRYLSDRFKHVLECRRLPLSYFVSCLVLF